MKQGAACSLLFLLPGVERRLSLCMILIEPEVHVPRAALPKRELSRFLKDACERVGLAGEVSVLLTTDEQLRSLNRRFRRKDRPTDVLSFPPAALLGGEPQGGDLAISVDTAKAQAASLGHSLLEEVKILMLHGLLHLAGFDHEQDTGGMARREGFLRRAYGLPAGLIQRAQPAKRARVQPAAGHPRVTTRSRPTTSPSSPARSR